MQTISVEDAEYIIDHCPVPAMVMSTDGKITYGNRVFGDLIKPIRLADVLGKSARTIEQPALQLLLGGGIDVEWQDADGKTRHFNLVSVPLPDKREARFFLDCTTECELRSSNRRLAEELRHTTLTDPVTGLLNERGITLALEPQIARCRRYNSPLSILVMRIRAPAPQNKVLIEVSQLLKDQLRWADLIGCTAQKMFLLVLPETSEEAARQLTEKLQALLGELGKKILDGAQIRSDYGYAGWRKSDTVFTLIERATASIGEAETGGKPESLAL